MTKNGLEHTQTQCYAISPSKKEFHVLLLEPCSYIEKNRHESIRIIKTKVYLLNFLGTLILTAARNEPDNGGPWCIYPITAGGKDNNVYATLITTRAAGKPVIPGWFMYAVKTINFAYGNALQRLASTRRILRDIQEYYPGVLRFSRVPQFCHDKPALCLDLTPALGFLYNLPHLQSII